MKITCQFYTVFQVLQVFLIESSFLSFCFALAFAVADIIFYKFFLASLNIVWKKFFHKFSFFNGFTQTPPTPWPKSAKRDENVLFPSG